MTGALLKGGLALVGLAALAFLAPQAASALSQARIEALLEAAGALAPLLFVALMAASVVVSPIPSLPLDVAAGAAFGPLLGTVYAVTGGLIGAVASFGIARALGAEYVARLLGGHVLLCPECSDRALARIVLVSRLIPVVSFDVVSYGAGLTGMSLRAFAVATALGMVPLTALYVGFGSALAIGPAWTLALGVGLVAGFLLVPRWIERRDPFSLARHFRHGEAEAERP